ncbi:MAG: hypothetical protein N2645_03790 [Clostridia bacterium]|nr:hypothetical protein [Clostridia bacterium]
MIKKQIKLVILIITLFFSGCIITFIGFFKGHDIAINVSRPEGATGWTTSQELISSWYIFPNSYRSVHNNTINNAYDCVIYALD